MICSNTHTLASSPAIRFFSSMILSLMLSLYLFSMALCAVLFSVLGGDCCLLVMRLIGTFSPHSAGTTCRGTGADWELASDVASWMAVIVPLVDVDGAVVMTMFVAGSCFTNCVLTRSLKTNAVYLKILISEFHEVCITYIEVIYRQRIMFQPFL